MSVTGFGRVATTDARCVSGAITALGPTVLPGSAPDCRSSLRGSAPSPSSITVLVGVVPAIARFGPASLANVAHSPAIVRQEAPTRRVTRRSRPDVQPAPVRSTKQAPPTLSA